MTNIADISELVVWRIHKTPTWHLKQSYAEGEGDYELVIKAQVELISGLASEVEADAIARLMHNIRRNND
jgi:hypothetical protein